MEVIPEDLFISFSKWRTVILSWFVTSLCCRRIDLYYKFQRLNGNAANSSH